MTPRTTYRLQFHAGFRFTDAIALIPYLAALGITHIYASPYLKARAGSTHGYDIVDHASLNPEIGTREEYDAFVRALREHGMGHILDFVPNHMGVGGDDNAWWLDLLRWGEDSHYADYFDVDWIPLREQLHGKVLLRSSGSSTATCSTRASCAGSITTAASRCAITSICSRSRRRATRCSSPMPTRRA